MVQEKEIARHHIQHIINAKHDFAAYGMPDIAEKLEDVLELCNQLPEPVEQPEELGDFLSLCPYNGGVQSKEDRIQLQEEQYQGIKGSNYLCLGCGKVFTIGENGTEKLEGEQDLPPQKIQDRFNSMQKKVQTCPCCNQLFVPARNNQSCCSEACKTRSEGKWKSEVTSD